MQNIEMSNQCSCVPYMRWETECPTRLKQVLQVHSQTTRIKCHFCAVQENSVKSFSPTVRLCGFDLSVKDTVLVKVGLK